MLSGKRDKEWVVPFISLVRGSERQGWRDRVKEGGSREVFSEDGQTDGEVDGGRQREKDG